MLCRAVLGRAGPGLRAAGRSRGLHQGPVGGWIRKVLDNPLPLGAGALVVGILQLRRIREREGRRAAQGPGAEKGEVQLAPDWQVSCYRSLPLRHVSRLWGAVNEVALPGLLRDAVLSSYARAFGCDLAEAERPDLASYDSLGQFFRRRLRAGARPLEEGAELVSPADGKVLHCGRLERGDLVEQVKGVSYSLQAFLGDRRLEGEVRPAGGQGEQPGGVEEGSCLYQCVIYLAPGDYHGFHSPVDWQVEARRHYPGELLSVNPRVASIVSNLFSLNERVAYLGRWRHGFFSMTAVGATNVGSVKVEMDPELCTNTRRWERETFHQRRWEDGGNAVRRGDYFGEFNLGSTIVLVFEAPADFSFSLEGGGETVKVGRRLAGLELQQGAALTEQSQDVLLSEQAQEVLLPEQAQDVSLSAQTKPDQGVAFTEQGAGLAGHTQGAEFPVELQ